MMNIILLPFSYFMCGFEFDLWPFIISLDTSIYFFLYFYCWLQKNYSHPNFFLYFAIDTVDIRKNMNESKKNLKSTVRWLFDVAVDAVDIKKFICHSIYLLCFYHWHRWHQKNILFPIFFSPLLFTPLKCVNTWMSQRKTS